MKAAHAGSTGSIGVSAKSFTPDSVAAVESRSVYVFQSGIFGEIDASDLGEPSVVDGGHISNLGWRHINFL
jgi:hypothetical protein